MIVLYCGEIVFEVLSIGFYWNVGYNTLNKDDKFTFMVLVIELIKV